MTGWARTGLDIYEDCTSDPLAGAMFRPQTVLTAPGKMLSALRESLSPEGGAYEKALTIMHGVHKALAYCPGATAVHQPAEAAFARGRGVCQDYAHAMLSLLRMEGIPARYVTGMLLGEGASHAWVEALCRGYWYGFDPTNDWLVDDGYIRVCCGRDSSGCDVIRGSFYGLAAQHQQETVLVEAR